MQKQGEKVAILIRAKGWTQKEFAEHIGYTPEHLSRILNEEPIKPRPLDRIVKGLNIYPVLITGNKELGKGNMPEGVSEETVMYPADPEKTALLEEIKQLREENQRLKAALYDEMRLSGRLPEAP